MANATNKRVKGLNKVARNLNKAIRQIENRSLAGLIEAGAFIHNDMENVYPVIPEDTGKLRASWINEPNRKGKLFYTKIGFTAAYAAYVHEMVDRADHKINWSRPNSGPKFLEAALRRNTNKILEIIANRARV